MKKFATIANITTQRAKTQNQINSEHLFWKTFVADHFNLKFKIMAFVLQSTVDDTLYFNGSTLNEHGFIFAIFDPITNARQFDTSAAALEVSETFYVPVRIVEI